jgi:hypothetical protein
MIYLSYTYVKEDDLSQFILCFALEYAIRKV